MGILSKSIRIWSAVPALLLCVGLAWGATPDKLSEKTAAASTPLLLPPPNEGSSPADGIYLPQSNTPEQINPAGGLLGYQHGASGSLVPLATLGHLRGVRINHLVGHGLVVGLQNTGDSQQTLFSIQFLLNSLRREDVTIPSSLNPQNIQTRNLAGVIITADLPPFARVGSRVDALVSALGDARSLQGGTLMMTPLRGADGRVYALAQGPLTLEGYFAAASGGASERKNFQTAGQIPGGATVEREVADNFSKAQQLEIDLNDPDAAVAMRAAQAIRDRYDDVKVDVLDPGTLQITLPPSISPVRFTAALDEIAVTPGESDRVVMDERTGTIVVGGAVSVGKAAISHGSLTVTIEPTLTASQPGPFSRAGSTVSMKSAKISAKEDKGEFFILPKDASVEQITETLNAVGTKPGDTIAIFEGLRAAGALHGELIIR
ncbi:MAG TPA: flagellar basal body P-ring protein FlgI, partial [Candidatus Binataceae bacterium]|nr:flagellar basal body P-ring protein FlgI [Candidatus Binataceae bacterium]